MTLAARLLIAFGLLAVISTASVGLLVRNEWRDAESEGFRQQVEGARVGIQLELSAEQNAVHDMLRPLCEHDAFIDRALVDLEAGRLGSGRRLALAQLVPDEMKALRLNELVLVTGAGEVLGAGHDPSLVGTRSKHFAKLLADSDAAFARVRAPATTRDATFPAALTGRCVRASGSTRIGLVGARYLTHLLERMGNAYAVRLAIDGSPDATPRADEITTRVVVDEGAGLRLVVAKSRRDLDQRLRQLDRVLLMTGGATLIAAILIAVVLARSLANPLAALSREVREVVEGEPRQVPVRGTAEVKHLAEAFNKTLRDLAALRRRHAAIERIAAWREVARRVAHEIKNPLTPIRSSIETLRRLRERDDPKFDEYFQEATAGILDDVHRIATIASDFARFARLPSPRPAPVDVTEVARTTVSMHASSGIPIGLRAEACPTIQADRDQLAQMLINLLQNAMDAVRSTEGGRIEVIVEPSGADFVRIEVRDNGPGVAADLRPRLFEPYVTTKDHGTGLGLPIVQRIVIEHGGEIAYQPAPNGGACFSVVLPCAGPTAPPDSQDPSRT